MPVAPTGTNNVNEGECPINAWGEEGFGVWALLELTDAFMLTITGSIKS